jgi:hypothetical protein
MFQFLIRCLKKESLGDTSHTVDPGECADEGLIVKPDSLLLSSCSPAKGFPLSNNSARLGGNPSG